MQKELIKQIAQKIFEEVFWGDYTYTVEDIIKILLNPSRKKERFFIFQKAFFNLKEPAILTKVFSEEELKEHLARISPHQKRPHLSERVKIWRNIFLGEKNEIPRAKWKFT